MRPFEAARRVYLILDAHLLRDDSANALLKSLEEPPAYGVFVLVSDHAERMLPTILSPRPAGRRSGASRPPSWPRPPATPMAARAAMGDLGRAEQLAGDAAAAERRRAYLDLARALAASTPRSTRPRRPATVAAAAGRRRQAGAARTCWPRASRR